MSDKPAFTAPLPVGQLNMPDPGEFREMFEGIFARRRYTHHGPLELAVDEALAGHFAVRHAIAVVNGTLALTLLLRAMELRGEVIVPSFTFPATVQSLVWAGLRPVFCDVDPATQMLDAKRVEALITADTSAILGVHIWGRGCDPHGLARLAKDRSLQLLFDAAHATSCTFEGQRIGGFGRAEIFSFHATKILSGAEGGCITTNDDALASRLRTLRSFQASDEHAAGILRMNAGLSEAQAAMILLGLRHLPRFIEENRERYELYRQGLKGINGLEFVDYAAGEQSNYQFAVVRIEPEILGMSRDELLEWLQARNVLARRYFHPGVHRTEPFASDMAARLSVTDELCQVLLQLPTGQAITHDHVRSICALIQSISTEQQPTNTT
ncbi:dTDP-4-amino-4,6-dideoxygalactose transaminase [Pseudomonas sp. JUb42]|uniref:aminotransferase class I/II-fold pyridoxal phosphate-dependent enzyme n=1 Tax=Pseudomonas sp. JUb42 TaxID=2940611 RepID=UPI002168C194|nr:aminotransferase class I/II-fold pyridoxal phosphate-dependent enzyme [Pseudomonas sp. JUb42]MCS3470579.1 dTDP-4-amino-4,6-dideoxygalactose transaminase [Pseudomonas sp. JUb42]